MDSRIPVTILTGFLGAGKTTLLNRILTEKHGLRIAVIENEFGEIGIDHELVINTEEELFEMNNGCICCTVRGDLIRIVGNLMKRRHQFDRILVETTGLADPGPVVQTFLADDEMQTKLMVDAVVTVVDARHILLHLDESDEAKEQVALRRRDPPQQMRSRFTCRTRRTRKAPSRRKCHGQDSPHHQRADRTSQNSRYRRF